MIEHANFKDFKRTVFLIEPIGKPRVLRGERSKTAEKWRNYKKHLQSIAHKLKFKLPEGFYHIVFYVPPPLHLSEEEKQDLIGTPCRDKPDRDNLEKAFLDALYPKSDSQFWDGRTTKLWGIPGRIEIYIP